MATYTSTNGHRNLPRYFSAVFDIVKKLRRGRIDFVLPDGRIFRAEGPEPGRGVELVVKNPECFARLVREGDLGFSDAYLEGWWSVSDLQAFMDLLLDHNDDVFRGFPGMSLVRYYERIRHWMNGNSRAQAKKNISYHYDLGNTFYAKWLDETMTYSSALFSSTQEDLSRAQRAKYASMIDKMGVSEGDRVLEIGCGWGGFAEYAALERGLRVTGLTISKEQRDFAVRRMKNAGIDDRVEIALRDYRDERGSYDGVVSIEMFEAVGEKYWPTYFGAVRDRLKPGGLASLQIITIANKKFAAYRKSVDFIQKNIFPGGMLPSPTVLREQIRSAGLKVSGSIEFGDSYSQTLRRWSETFNDKWDDISAMGFDERFHRMWNYYLMSCAAAFRAGTCDVTQITMQRPV